jgi:putative transposase
MARLARIVVPHIPHHITQRGNRRQQTFFNEQDYQAYLQLLAEWCSQCGVDIWAYCLMPNHVHLILVPKTEEALSTAISEIHRRYTRHVNFREGWRGHLWQGRFSSFPMDERYLLAAARYVELNPVKAGLVLKAQDYRWSSASAHVKGLDDGIVQVKPLLELMPRWLEFLSKATSREEESEIEKHERTGRPMGDEAFLVRLEAKTGRAMRKAKPGPKPKILMN